MADRSNIAWTDASWNPVRGCERVSEGCRRCYAEVLAARHSYEGGWGHEVAHYVGGKPRWTGVIETKEQKLKLPLTWKEPRMVFVNSMSDLFHERVPFNFVDKIFAVMDHCERHTFQILTKRPERMLDYCQRINGEPLKNVWLGVSVEDQATADERIPLLLQTPAAVRWSSAEPLLGPVRLREPWLRWDNSPINWVVIGGESGSGYRPMDIDAARSLIAQCKLAGMPVFVKQDSGLRPGMKGRFTDEEWALKQYPACSATGGSR